MRLLSMAVSCCMLISGALANGQARMPESSDRNRVETRCGWFSNPSPANISLYDRDAEWTIGVQGGYQIEGEWDWPDFKRGQWVRTNTASYGYGCACLQLRVDRETHEVLEIKSVRPRALTACRQDRYLKKKWTDIFK